MRKYLTIARVSLQNALAYRASVLSGFVFYTLFIYVFMSLWRAIYQVGSIDGYTHQQIVWYLIMTELIMFGCRSGVFGAMNEDVKSGAIAYLLNRPAHYIFYQFAQAMGQIVFSVACFGLLAAVLGYTFVGPLATFNPVHAPLIALSIVCGIAMNFFLLMSMGLTAFFIEENFAVYLIYQKLVFMLGVFLPVEFLPGWLQVIAKNLPFSYVAWAPARLFVNFSYAEFFAIFPRQLIWLAASMASAFAIYNAGVKRVHANGG